MILRIALYSISDLLHQGVKMDTSNLHRSPVTKITDMPGSFGCIKLGQADRINGAGSNFINYRTP